MLEYSDPSAFVCLVDGLLLKPPFMLFERVHYSVMPTEHGFPFKIPRLFANSVP